MTDEKGNNCVMIYSKQSIYFILILMFSITCFSCKYQPDSGKVDSNSLDTFTQGVSVMHISPHVDNSLVISGNFAGQADLDPSMLEDLRQTQGLRDSFVIKLNGNGENTSIVTWGGEGTNRIVDTATDAQGNIYIVGLFTGKISFEPQEDGTYISSASDDDIFIGMIDSNSNIIWVKVLQSRGENNVTSIDVDNNGNIYIAGSLTSSVDFDFSDNLEIVQHGSFLYRINSDLSFGWVKNWIGLMIADITNTDDGHIFATGNFKDTVDFDPGPNLLERTADNNCIGGCILGLDNSNGEYTWDFTWGSGRENYGTAVEENNGSIYLCGSFSGSFAEVKPDGCLIDTSNGYYDSLFVKFSHEGHIIYALSWGSEMACSAEALTIVDDCVYVTGWAKGITDFDPSSSTDLHNCERKFWDAYISKFDTDGNHLWSTVWGEDNRPDEGSAVSAFGENMVAVSGKYDSESFIKFFNFN